MIETIDSAKLATSVDVAWAKLAVPNHQEPLKVLVQVNTSEEKGYLHRALYHP